MKRVIGLTGGIASGKSTVSKKLKELGCYISDADAVSRTLLDKSGAAYEAVKKAFPEHVDADGAFNRKSLGAYVFSHSDALRTLNGITHPIISRLIAEDIDRHDGIIVIDAPLLIEVGLHRLCESIWLVTADRETRIARAMARSGLTRTETENRIDSQLSDDEKKKYASHIIDNSGTADELFAAAEALLNEEIKEMRRKNE